MCEATNSARGTEIPHLTAISRGLWHPQARACSAALRTGSSLAQLSEEPRSFQASSSTRSSTVSPSILESLSSSLRSQTFPPPPFWKCRKGIQKIDGSNPSTDWNLLPRTLELVSSPFHSPYFWLTPALRRDALGLTTILLRPVEGAV